MVLSGGKRNTLVSCAVSLPRLWISILKGTFAAMPAATSFTKNFLRRFMQRRAKGIRFTYNFFE